MKTDPVIVEFPGRWCGPEYVVIRGCRKKIRWHSSTPKRPMLYTIDKKALGIVLVVVLLILGLSAN